MIKASFESIDAFEQSSFTIRAFEETSFRSPYHYHPEYEITLITKGKGKRYVGNHTENFSEGDLVLLGPNLPHCWKSEPLKKGQINAKSIVIQFNEDFLGKDFFNSVEFGTIRTLLDRSERGIVFNKSAVPALAKKIHKLLAEEMGANRVILLLDLLYTLSLNKEFCILNGITVASVQNGMDFDRINIVFNYIKNNFIKNVCLNEVANLACMTPNAFCKYFKKVTNKTFTEVVIEYRLNYATTLLINTDKSITQICFDCGFNDLAHFIRMFKIKTKTTPLQFKKKFQTTCY